MTINSFPNSKAKAGNLMEFRWDASKNYKKLYYWQSSSKQRDRATYYLVLRERDRNAAVLKLSITVPDYFDAKINPKKLSLCKLQLGGMLKRTKCIEKIPAVFEIAKDRSEIDIFPDKPIPDGGHFALVMKIFNPASSGMYQFNALAQAPGDVPMAGYLGSWNIDIE
nr:DUF2808 domain-containing protein [Prochlorococcus sp. MIT 1341]